MAVGRDRAGWHERVLDALRDAGPCDRLAFDSVDLESADWLVRVAPFDVVIWNPAYMGPLGASHFKEKVFLLEGEMSKRVVPSFSTIQHFESKIAQSYVLDLIGVPHPKTLVTFEHADACRRAPELGLPVVAKRSWGADSSDVRLLSSSREVQRYIDGEFAQHMWDRAKASHSSLFSAALASIGAPWFAAKVRSAVLKDPTPGCVLLQEFVPDNAADLRVKVVGSRVLGYWRNNRPGDFRASGGGLRDYDRPIPEAALRLCLRASALMRADTMAYDVLFRAGEPLIAEMSYGSIPSTVHDAQGHWVLEGSGELRYEAGHRWPQELLVTSLLEELGVAPATPEVACEGPATAPDSSDEPPAPTSPDYRAAPATASSRPL